MDTRILRQFAQQARIALIEQVTAKMEQVLPANSAARRENSAAVAELEKAIDSTSQEQVIEKVAYTWFNRFCALRFMDVNDYTRIRVVSPADDSQIQPEILADAKMGHIDINRVPERTRDRVQALLNNSAASHDPEQEAYRLLLVAECNHFSQAMPYLFERITDYTELLLPDDLLSANSVLTATRAALTSDHCQDVEVIGWLYQFYISEKKEEVLAGVKKNRKLTPETIPAATQLFTPHWIVRYLVENSLGRLWMLNHPSSHLADQMEYYIPPETPETDFLKITKPEDIKVCDPACGSGHMLTYAFDLLHSIYEEVGTNPSEIPEKILTHNLYGIELDERAGDLAAFALTMKARTRQRRFLEKGVEPNICVLENVKFSDNELNDYISATSPDLFTQDLRETLKQFEEAKHFGSLIRPKLENAEDALATLDAHDMEGNLFLAPTHAKVLTVLRQVDYLSQKYHAVVANPPYATASGLNVTLRDYSQYNYNNSKNDLYSMFIERNTSLAVKNGFIGMITMQSWMYSITFQGTRELILTNTSLLSLLHLGPRVFPEIQGERVQTVAFIVSNRAYSTTHRSLFFRLIEGNTEQKEQMFLKRQNCIGPIPQRYFLELDDFSIAYKMLSMPNIRENILAGNVVECSPYIGSQPGSELIHFWWEKSQEKVGARWKKYNKGGPFRRWYGNAIWVLDYGHNGENVLANGGQLSNQQVYGRCHISWTRVSSKMNLRWYGENVYFDNTAPAIVENKIFLLAYFNSCVGEFNRLGKFSGTKIEAGHVKSIAPLTPSSEDEQKIHDTTTLLLDHSRDDWNSSEISWDFVNFSLLQFVVDDHTMQAAFQSLRNHWNTITRDIQRLEEKNNRIFIEAYGLEDELAPEIQPNEITLTCNPHYRYRGDKADEELEELLLADTMREFISYAVGCMFGRFSLDKPGLVLANQGETLADYLAQVPEPSFTPDEDNVIPILDGEWFADDITERFRQFLRVTFGDEHYDDNLHFIEKAIGRDIRRFFLRDFYNDHVRRYKKRPIYWLFSSPQGTFNALIYMHRYQPHTVGTVLSYLRDFRKKLDTHLQHLEKISISTDVSQGEKTRALRDIDKLRKQILELDDYERDTLYPLATQQIAIDLDDGVKANYPKFGSALKRIVGLEAKGDD